MAGAGCIVAFDWIGGWVARDAYLCCFCNQVRLQIDKNVFSRTVMGLDGTDCLRIEEPTSDASDASDAVPFHNTQL